MEKLVYVLWKKDGVAVEAFRDDLVADTGTRLIELGARKLEVSVADEHTFYARGSIITQMKDDPITGIISLWLDTALQRAPHEELIAGITSKFTGYLVLESTPIVNTKHRVPIGQRTPGINTVALLRKPERLEYDAWREIWQGSHTAVAIETQSTFLYVQNVVVRPVTGEAPAWVAIVEEGFPEDALRDPHVFFDAVGDDAKLEANQKRMLESCARFIDFGELESHVFSHYVLEDWSDH